MAKQLQHYVPRFYLKAWLDADGAIFCLQKQSGNVFGTKDLMKVGGENNFYRLRDLTVSDMFRHGAHVSIVLGKLPIAPTRFRDEMRSAGATVLSLTDEHVLTHVKAAESHPDPFDRLLLSVAEAENLVLLTADTTLVALGRQEARLPIRHV
jgi:hypothetical protein